MSFQYESEIPQPIVPRSAAVGYAEREFADDSVFSKTLDHYTDSLPNPSFLDYARDTRENATRAEKILRVGKLDPVSRAIESGYMRTRYNRMFKEALAPLAQANNATEFLPNAIGPMADEAIRTFGQPMVDRSITHILRICNHADHLAAETGVTSQQILANDALFGQLHRDTYTPQEYVEQLKKYTDGFSSMSIVQAMTADIKSLAKVIFPDSNFDELDDEDLSPITMAIRLAMLEDSEVSEWLETTVDNNRRTVNAYALMQVRRFWGQAGVDGLPPELQANLR